MIPCSYPGCTYIASDPRDLDEHIIHGWAVHEDLDNASEKEIDVAG